MICRRTVPAVVFLILLSTAFGLAQTTGSREAAVTSGPLENLAGEYNETAEPDTPLSFYAEGGKLMVESERGVPTELKSISAVEFSFPGSNATVRFTLDAAGHASSALFSTKPNMVYT